MINNFKCSNGNIEYFIEGKGPAVLIFHGGHDSCRGYFRVDKLLENGYTVVIPTRPGYGGTDLSVGKSCQDAVSSFYALLDELKIKQTAVIGVSAGGPTALAFAKAYPQKTNCLILESAVTKPWFHYLTFQYWICRSLLSEKNQKKFWNNLRQKLAEDSLKLTLKTLKMFTRKNPIRVYEEYDVEEKKLIKQLLFDNDSGAGFVPDMEHRVKNIEDIICPALIIHSKDDASVPFAHAKYAYKKITTSEIFVAPVASHFLYIGPGSEDVMKKRMDFLKKHIYNLEKTGANKV